MRLKGAINGPARHINVTTAIVAGTTANYEQFAAFGPLVCIEDTTFASGCVMVGGDTNDKPLTSVTYGAGSVVWSYFTTLQLATGSVQAMALKELPTLEY